MQNFAESNFTRRGLLAAALGAGAFTASCSRSLAKRYSGWLLVASAEEKAITVADLSEFRRTTTIPLGQAPAQLVRSGDRVFVTCPEARQLIELDPAQLRIRRKVVMPGSIVSAQATGNDLLLVAVAEPSMLVLVDAKSATVKRRIPLSFEPASLDVAGDMVALASRNSGLIARISLSSGKTLGTSVLHEPCDPMRFRGDGRLIVAGLPRARQIVTFDATTGALQARLPLHFAPGRFSFNGDGGQMFVTATGEDAIAIVSPYQNQIDQTIVAGREPYAMAVSAPRNLLLVTNPESGDLTILDIETRRLAASVHIGGEPGEVLLTPDDEYALVIGRDVGDVAVVRMKTVLDKAIRTKPILTMFPMGSAPQSALVIPRDV